MGRKKGSREFLFPRNLNFTKVCSCHECCTKISALKDFEKELMSKLKLVEGCKSQFCFSYERCQTLQDNIGSTIMLYVLFHAQLQDLNKKTGVSSTQDCDWFSRLKDAFWSMTKLLFVDEEDILQRVDVDEPCSGEEAEIQTSYRIGRLFSWYERARAKDEAHELLNKILDIENQHERERRAAKSLDPSVSKMYIEKQIELLKELPFEEVEREMKEIFDKMSPCDENLDMLDVVRDGIYYTSRRMFETSTEFLEKYRKIKWNVKGHDLSGLETTLDSLTNQMKLFNDQWKNDHIPLIAHIIAVCQQGFCPQGLCPPNCPHDWECSCVEQRNVLMKKACCV